MPSKIQIKSQLRPLNYGALVQVQNMNTKLTTLQIGAEVWDEKNYSSSWWIFLANILNLKL